MLAQFVATGDWSPLLGAGEVSAWVQVAPSVTAEVPGTETPPVGWVPEPIAAVINGGQLAANSSGAPLLLAANDPALQLTSGLEYTFTFEGVAIAGERVSGTVLPPVTIVAPTPVVVGDAVMTSGSAVLTSASLGFTSAMVGSTAVVAGAGEGGAALVAEIASVTNGTTAVLAAAASASVSAAQAAVTAGVDVVAAG